MISKITSSAILGIDAIPVEVEADIANGLPSFTIVGLPDKTVDEAKDRVKTAIKNSNARFPTTKVVVNLAPADIPKAGPMYDLPIAIAILAANEQIPPQSAESLFIGELSLDGKLRHTTGVLPSVIMAKEKGIKKIYLPKENALEASLIDEVEIIPVPNLSELVFHLKNELKLSPYKKQNNDILSEPEYELDFSNVSGQEAAKRALEIAAAGGHNLFMSGPPGAGKTLLAKSFASILPNLSKQEMLEVTKIYSIAGQLKNKNYISVRPFRSPHHTASDIALIGGGKNIKPGEISLAHRGVLFLDELPEFPRNVLEVMRQPLESGDVTVSRAVGTLTFPAKFILIAASNPCPCGYFGSGDKECFCSPTQILKYKKKLSGPLLDRIDIHLGVSRVKYDKLTKDESAENSKNIRERVKKARELQEKRFIETELLCNSEMGVKEIKKYCRINNESDALLKQASINLKLSARAVHKILKLARTIADLEETEQIETKHVAEAIQFRQKD